MNVVLSDFVDISCLEDKKYGYIFTLSFSPKNNGDDIAVLNLGFDSENFLELLRQIGQKASVKKGKVSWHED